MFSWKKQSASDWYVAKGKKSVFMATCDLHVKMLPVRTSNISVSQRHFHNQNLRNRWTFVQIIQLFPDISNFFKLLSFHHEKYPASLNDHHWPGIQWHLLSRTPCFSNLTNFGKTGLVNFFWMILLILRSGVFAIHFQIGFRKKRTFL